MQPQVSKTRGLTPQQKQDLWEKWKESQPLSEIGRALGKHAGSTTGMLAIHGGIAPHGRSILTVSRDVRRNGGKSEYRTNQADQHAWAQSKRPKKCSLALNEALRIAVATKLRLDWSPEQVAGWLKRQFPDDRSMHVSHETIYRSLFIQARGVLKKELVKHLRSRRGMRKSRYRSSEEEDSRTSISDAVSIRARPKNVEGRAIPGHWEGDLISGSKNSLSFSCSRRLQRATSSWIALSPIPRDTLACEIIDLLQMLCFNQPALGTQSYLM